MHGTRPSYHIHNEGEFNEPSFLSAGGGGGCPVAHAAPPACPPFRFGRMFARPGKAAPPKGWNKRTIKALIRLGLCMNDPEKYCRKKRTKTPRESVIPAGFTYLGQFIAHEVTFDSAMNEVVTSAPKPKTLRSPAIDLDSLYGPEPRDEHSRQFYEDEKSPRLKIGETIPANGIDRTFPNDLCRDEKTGKALIGDPRNDVNLAVAQTHVALAKFHNKVVDTLVKSGHAKDGLFECARAEVVRHFQWVVLHDYLPTIVDADVLDCVLKHGRRWFKVGKDKDLFMPLEFSAAAFRLGHSMVRRDYDWNLYHSVELGAPRATLSELFQLTEFSGDIGTEGKRGVPSEWVIDWRRFYEFPVKSAASPEQMGYDPSPTGVNMAGRIDTNFDFRLDLMSGFPHNGLPDEKKPITVRNLLRGFALGLPTGEEVAKQIGETPLRPGEVAKGPHEELLSARAFKGKTPLWYYILKEAELNGGSRLGRVGSRIVAETLVGIIENSDHSIRDDPKWYPKYTRRGVPGTKSATFGMVDLLDFAGVVNPLQNQ